MDNSKQHRTATRIAICLSVIALVSACGGGAGGTEGPEPPLFDPAVIATGNTSNAIDPANPNEFVPTPGNGLDIAFDDPSIDPASNSAYIESQWLHMQTCLEISAQEPTITVVEGKLTPADSNDDVIRHISGQIIASAHVTDTSATIQVHTDDFDGSLGKPGSYLRSITGRYLWLANGLQERDYPYHCADGE